MDKTKLKKELEVSKEGIILLEVSSNALNEASLFALKLMVDKGKIGIIVSASRPIDSLLETYGKQKINLKDILIIDAVSHKEGAKTEGTENVFFVENVKSLTNISIMVKESMEKIKKPKFVFIDSVTTMLIHNNPEVYMKFLHDILTAMRNQKAAGVLVFVETELNEKVKIQLETVCDKVIKVA